MHRPLGLALAVAALIGCATPAFPDEPWVVKYASERLSCPKDQIVASQVEDLYYQVSGCGKSDHFMQVCVANSCKLNTIADLTNRAAYDLACGADQLQITKLDRDTIGVSGCDQRASYKATLQGWVMNASTTVESSKPASESSEAEPGPGSTDPTE